MTKAGGIMNAIDAAFGNATLSREGAAVVLFVIAGFFVFLALARLMRRSNTGD